MTDIINTLIVNGDMSKLNAEEKIQYYKGYCERMGLDPYTQPFKLLKLNGREIMYCDRSGTQQLNKLHKVSHKITARENVSDCYVVTASAYTPDKRQTESIGAVHIAGLKGEALCNAMMKAETKAKRRATLDLLGLGVLDESELDTLPHHATQDILAEDPPTMRLHHSVKKGFKQVYETSSAIEKQLDAAEVLQDVAALYYANSDLVEADPDLKAKFSTRRLELEKGRFAYQFKAA